MGRVITSILLLLFSVFRLLTAGYTGSPATVVVFDGINTQQSNIMITDMTGGGEG